MSLACAISPTPTPLHTHTPPQTPPHKQQTPAAPLPAVRTGRLWLAPTPARPTRPSACPTCRQHRAWRLRLRPCCSSVMLARPPSPARTAAALSWLPPAGYHQLRHPLPAVRSGRLWLAPTPARPTRPSACPTWRQHRAWRLRLRPCCKPGHAGSPAITSTDSCRFVLAADGRLPPAPPPAPGRADRAAVADANACPAHPSVRLPHVQAASSVAPSASSVLRPVSSPGLLAGRRHTSPHPCRVGGGGGAASVLPPRGMMNTHEQNFQQRQL